MTVSSFVLALIAWTIGHDRDLRDTDRKPDLLQAAGTTVTFVVALAITVAFPATSYWPLLLLVLTDPVVRQIRRSRAKATRADA
jgi:hypothetical protein